MYTHETNLKVDRFLGIRLLNPIVDMQNGYLSAYDAKNVELRYAETSSNVGIYSMKGRQKIATLEGKKIIGQWESIQLGVRYWLVYAIDDAKGYLYHYKPSAGTFDLLYDDLSPVPKANGITTAQGFDDVFVFTNGVDDYVAVMMSADEKCKCLDAVDAEGRNIRGLILKMHNGRLVTNCGNRIHWSRTGDIYDWSSSDTGYVTNAAYQEFDSDVTAAEVYGDALVVFTNTHSVQFQGNPGDVSSFSRSEATGGGCAGPMAVCKFDNKLFYYDAKARNVFAYYLYDSGQTRPSDGLAGNMLKFFAQIDENKLGQISIVAVSSSNKSELWFHLPLLEGSVILIYDYLKQEWVCRDMGPLTSIQAISGDVYGAHEDMLVKEDSGDTVLGEFYPCEYTCHTIDLGSDSNLKIPKMPLIFTFDTHYSNNFSLEFMIDERTDTAKIKRIEKQGDAFLIWATEDGAIGGVWAHDDGEGGYYWNYDDAFDSTYNLHGLVPFRQLRLKFYTEKSGDSFGIKRIEMKRVKIKTKMIG
ncbi:MAG: hypothetical protein LBU87_03705 [Lactobacillales bacterium]|jgi:hypothetical protein|nr:hypothetical protein [Lactobacillales bacterium]